MLNKMLFFFYFFLYFISTAKAQQIIDTSFAKVIRNQCPACIDTDNQLTDAADTLKKLIVKEWKVKSLQGISFPDLEHFECSFTSVSEFPPLNFPRLKHFESRFCSDLISFSELNLPLLEHFQCDAMYSMAELPSLNFPLLKHFEFNFTQVSTLPLLNSPHLLYFDCSYNELTNLADFNFPNLVFLDCRNNPIQKLCVLPTTLEELFIDNTQIQCLPNQTKARIDIQLPVCDK